MRGVLAAVVLTALAGPFGAAAESRVSAGGATVTFPVGVPEQQPIGENRGPHGDPLLMMFLFTFDKTEIDPAKGAAFAADMAGVKSSETWRAFDKETQQGFSFTTAPFPDRLAASVWAKTCMPPTEQRPFICRPIRVGGAVGREYLARARNPLQPDDHGYIVLQVVVRNDRLYLLSYAGVEAGAGAPPDHPSNPDQNAFLNSLRFGAP